MLAIDPPHATTGEHLSRDVLAGVPRQSEARAPMDWAQIYTSYLPSLLDAAARHILRRPDLDPADVVHDTFVAALSAPPDTEPDWQDFLTRLLAQVCADCVEQFSQEDPAPAEEEVLFEDPVAVAIRRVNACELRRRVLRIMDYMTPRQREITRLRLFEGLSVGEIAALANTSSSNISQIVIRCLNKLGPVLIQLDLFDQHDLERMRPPRRAS